MSKSSTSDDVNSDANEIQEYVVSKCSTRTIHYTFAKFIDII